MPHYRFSDAFAPPPANRAERQRARSEVGIADIPIITWSATVGGREIQGTGGTITIGETEINVREAEVLAARRTAESN